MKVFALAFLLFASTPIIIDTTKLVPGRTVTHTAGSRTVTSFREGNTVTVKVEEGKRVDTIAIRREDGKLAVSHRDNGEPRELVALDRRPVIVDGIDLEPYMAGGFLGAQPQGGITPLPPRPDRRSVAAAPRYYTCPKDETMVRIPPGRSGPDELLCPLDGTPMRAGTGSDSQIFLLQ